jgi:hypothetical protein
MSSPPSVVVVHSSSPRRDYEILVSVLPRRFQPEATTGDGGSTNSTSNNTNNTRQQLTTPRTTNASVSTTNQNQNRQKFSLVAASESKRWDTILVLPNPTTISPNNNRTNAKVYANADGNGNGSVRVGVTVTDDLEFETVPLTTSTTNSNSKVYRTNAPSVAAVTSFASLILDSKDELRSMAELVSEREGLAVIEKKIEVNINNDNSGSKTSSIPLAKFVLPGGCLVTLSTATSWTSQEARRLTTEFMTAIIPMSPQSQTGSLSGSVSTSKSRVMRRTLSMPDMIPPMVTTNHRRNNINIIPTLETKVLSFGGNYQPFPLNAETPIPIETELFSGNLLLICRPTTDPAKVDPYWNERIFSKKKRRVIMQLQGKLKYTPTGTVFAGMEISDPMKLGLIANGLCNLILKLVRGFNPALHYSFGSSAERAHICFPASTFWETFVVTPPGETPPAMGEIDFESGETAEMAAARKSNKTKIDWNTQDTYSMSFYSMFVDFPTWSIVSLPTGRDVSLQTFWGNSFARIVLYEVDNGKHQRNDTKQQQHSILNTRYLLGVELKALAENGVAALASRSSAALLEENDGSEEEDGDETSESQWGSEMGGEESISSTLGDMALMPAFDEEDDDDDDEVDTSLFFDTIESLPGGDGTSSVDATPIDMFSASSHNTLLSIIDTFCPCWIEMFSRRGKYAMLYAFCGTKKPGRPLFRTADMAGELLRGNREEDAEVDERFSHRVSTTERNRRIFGFKYAEAHTTDNSNKAQLRRFHKIQCRYDFVFLKRSEPTATKVTGDKSGIVARALSDRHWKEERVILIGESGELLFHHVGGSKIHFRITLSSVINVSPLANGSDLVPLPSYFYLQIETFVRVTILMFSSQEERDSWVETLETIRRDRSTRLYASELLQFEIPTDEFLSKSTMWNCQKRKLLNFRRYSFRTPRSKPPEETLQLAERALAKVLTLKPKGANDSDLREFLDCAAALKEADAHSLNEEEKCAFFLNIYHIMIMHSYIILGPPASGSEWISYFNNIAYQCSDDIFSLAELEHNIIRAKMSFPSNFLSRFVLPKSQYHFALARPDFRLNFALNSGSLSMPTSVVPVYRAALLNEQLNSITKDFVGYTVYVRPNKGKNDVQVSLPRLCQWFAEDFGPNASASDVVVAIEPYLSNEKRDDLYLIWNSKKKIYDIGIFGVKYLPFNYECRFLTASIE